MLSLLKKKDPYQTIMVGFIMLLMMCVLYGVYKTNYLIWLLPISIIGLAGVIYNYRLLYYLFFILLPFSVEVYLPNGLGTDLPTEPIMILLTGIGVVLGLSRLHAIDYRYIKHPITLVLLFHLAWIVITALLSQNQVVSFKFLLAKLWYVIPFYFMTLYLMNDTKKVKRNWWLFAISLTLSVAFIMLKYVPYDFKFKHIEKIMGPFFRNHVNYATIMAMTMPWFWALFRTSKGRNAVVALGIMLFMLVSIYYSYTRAAMLAVFMAVGVYYVIKFRLMKGALSASLIVAIVLGLFITREMRWLNFAPDFERTVTHRDFNDLLSATYKLEDISTMERVYRWIAGGHMINERPFTGFGPGTFTFFYKEYTVSSFKTYVSDNPENSGIHSYYLMTWVDQGTIGLLILLILVLLPLIYGEQLYHQLVDREERIILMAALLSLVILDAILVMNDMLEVDKTGPLYFICLAIVTLLSIRGKKKILDN